MKEIPNNVSPVIITGKDRKVHAKHALADTDVSKTQEKLV
jgi:hypothetical protein